MIPEAIHSIVRSGGPLPEDTSAFFFVEWNEDDDQIPGLCEAVLKTGTLSADWDDDDSFIIVWRGKRIPVTLTKSLLTWLAASPATSIADAVLPLPVSDALLWPSRGDRHTTLLALNDALHPDYEIRHVRESDGPAFAPLSTSDWTTLEQQYGVAAVEAVFVKLGKFPNLFTA